MEPHEIAQALDRLQGVPAFAQLAPFNQGGIFVGRFSGQTPWERHSAGDEFVHVLEGEVKLTILMEREARYVTLHPGSFVVVPRGLWHRQLARTQTVTLLSATPTPTDMSSAEDPRGPKAN
jgi:quercetin dioxygenase-like cupin family protein